MTLGYNRFSGSNKERLSALSDGIFAVAMTLLVLDIHAPVMDSIHSEKDLLQSLISLSPRLLMFLMGFLTLGIFWNGQQAQLNQIVEANRHFTWIHIAFLAAISLMPFSTSLIAQYITYKTALIFYWFNIALLGSILFASWRYARNANLLKADISRDILCAVERRILLAQLLYAVSAIFCVINTYVSIVLIMLLQLNYAIAPRIRFLEKL